MSGPPSASGAPAGLPRGILLLVVAAAVAAGVYGRFAGIGVWPLGVDEFYISRSIDNVLRTGLPAFPCGGYYNRGLTFQYLVAGLRLLGWSPEFAGRFLAGLCSLAVLPAAYQLGRRLEGPLCGWLTVIILCLSIWEIEMARFARMYAPFQAVFAWYVIAYLRYTVDRHAGALWWMVVLSALGTLTWEGGVLLGLANVYAILLLHQNGRFGADHWRRLAGLLVLLVPLYLATRDLRGFADVPGEDAAGEEPSTPLHAAADWFAPLWHHPVWALGLLVPLGLTLPALRWIGGFRGRWLAGGGLCLALLAAAVHAFVLAAGILVLMPLTDLVRWRELSDRRARHFWWAIGGFLVYWCAASAAFTGLAGPKTAVLQFLFGFPDVFDQILRPWGRVLPILSAGIGLALLYSGWDVIAGERRQPDAAVLLSLLVVMALAIGATTTDRIETRYTFFLYPVLIALTVGAILMAARRRPPLRHAPILVTAAVPLLCFAATEDFQPKHLLEVDSGAVNFRVGMSALRAAHYYPRNEMRGAAEFLDSHRQPGDVVITGIPNLDEYYHHIDYFFLGEADPRYETYVCPDGATERWTNHPVLYTVAALKPIVASGRRVFASVYGQDEQRLRNFASTAGWSVTRIWTGTYGRSDMLLISAQPEGAQAP